MPVARFALPFAVLLATALPQAALANPISGQWRTDDGRAVVSIVPCGSGLCGNISRFLVPEPQGGARDTENPTRALRQRSLMGVPVLWSLKRVGAKWTGKGYSPPDGIYFNAEVSLVGDRLRIKGCKFVICKTKVWTRG